VGDVRGRCSVCPAELFQVGPLVAGQGTQPILLRTRPNQTPEWFGANPIPYSRAVALPKARPNLSDPLAVNRSILSAQDLMEAGSDQQWGFLFS
jgi:hypothetical protein